MEKLFLQQHNYKTMAKKLLCVKLYKRNGPPLRIILADENPGIIKRHCSKRQLRSDLCKDTTYRRTVFIPSCCMHYWIDRSPQPINKEQICREVKRHKWAGIVILEKTFVTLIKFNGQILFWGRRCCLLEGMLKLQIMVSQARGCQEPEMKLTCKFCERGQISDWEKNHLLSLPITQKV